MVSTAKINRLTCPRYENLPESLCAQYMRLCDDLIIRLSLVNKTFQTIAIWGELPVRIVDDLHTLYPKSTHVDTQDEQSVDLIIDWGGLHRHDNPRQQVHNHYQRLNRGGLFIGGCWGNETLQGFARLLIRTDLLLYAQAYQRLFPFIRPNVMAQLIQQTGFALPVVDWDRTRVRYKRAQEVLRDVFAGERVALLGRAVDHRYIRALESLFVRPDDFEVSYDWLWFHGWRDD